MRLVDPATSVRRNLRTRVLARAGMKVADPATSVRRNLRTRVLVRAGMPVALLPGRAPDTRLPEPTPG